MSRYDESNPWDAVREGYEFTQDGQAAYQADMARKREEDARLQGLLRVSEDYAREINPAVQYFLTTLRSRYPNEERLIARRNSGSMRKGSQVEAASSNTYRGDRPQVTWKISVQQVWPKVGTKCTAHLFEVFNDETWGFRCQGLVDWDRPVVGCAHFGYRRERKYLPARWWESEDRLIVKEPEIVPSSFKLVRERIVVNTAFTCVGILLAAYNLPLPPQAR